MRVALAKPRAFLSSAPLVVAAFGLAIASPALAQAGGTDDGEGDNNTQVTSLTVFGDSLVDAGNAATIFPGAANPALGYFNGRFTNGYDYTDLLSIDLFGTPATASLQGGTNFSFGGARATTTSFVPDLTEQLDFYQAFLATGGEVDPTGLFVLNFGGNDIFAATAPGAPAGFDSDTEFLLQAASNYAQGIQTLADLGATNFLITGFPNSAPDQIAFSLEAEVYLMSEISNLTLDEGTNINFYSYLNFFGRLAADPTQFGLPSDLDFETTCLAADAAPDCTGFFSFDGVHPTAAVHQALYADIKSQFGFSAPVPEPATWIMMLVGFGMVGAGMRRRNPARVTVAYA